MAAKVAGDGKPTTLAIRSGYQVQIDGRAVPIYGTSKALQPTSSRTRYSAQGRMREIVRAWQWGWKLRRSTFWPGAALHRSRKHGW